MYDLKIHKNFNTEKWKKFATEQQIFMIANEVQRLLTCIKNDIGFEAQRERIECALELADLTGSVQKGNFQHEFLRWREMFGGLYLLNKLELAHSEVMITSFLKTLLQMNPKSILILK